MDKSKREKAKRSKRQWDTGSEARDRGMSNPSSEAEFPGFAECLLMMRSRDASTAEHGFSWLEAHSSDFVKVLIEEFDREEASGGRLSFWLIELIVAAKSPDAFQFFATHLRADDPAPEAPEAGLNVWWWALAGLKLINNEQTQAFLWEAKSFEMKTPELTQEFRKLLESPHHWG